MSSKPLVLALLAGLSLVGFALGARSQAARPGIRGGQAGAEGRIPTSFYSDRVTADTHRDMQGTWRVEKLEWNGQAWEQGDLAGFALIGPGHMALEVHARIFLNTAEEMLVQTGLYRYDFNEVGEMVMYALIGTDNIQDPLEVTATLPGEQSRYRVRLADDVLILTRPQSSLQLRRAIQPAPPFSDQRRERQLERFERLVTGLDADAIEALVDRMEQPAPAPDSDE